MKSQKLAFSFLLLVLANNAEESPYSCGAQLRLPENQFNVTIGEPPPEDYTLDDLQERGFAYAAYMQGASGRPPTALGAKFRNFRVGKIPYSDFAVVRSLVRPTVRTLKTFFCHAFAEATAGHVLGRWFENGHV